MYLGGSIMTFALPMGAFIVIATLLFYLYRRPHFGPRLKYLTSGPVTSVMTREPGPVPAPAAKADGGAAPASAPVEAPPPADETGESDSSASEGKE
jgi:hypothetical protein